MVTVLIIKISALVMKYSELVEVYQDLEATQSNLEKTSILAETFSRASEEELQMLVKMCRGKVFAEWRSDEIGISSKLMVKAISKTTGISEEDIEDEWRETGDLGKTAQNLVENKRQQTLAQRTLNVEKVYDNLQEMAGYEGSGSQGKKLDNIAELLSTAEPVEACYIVRTVIGAMRVGVGEGTIRDALAEAFFAQVIEPEEIEEVDIEEGARIVLQEESTESFDKEVLEDLKDTAKVEILESSEMEDMELSRNNFNLVIVQEDLYDSLRDRAKEAVQHGFDVTNDFGKVARAAREGLEGLSELEMELFRPVKVMLAKKTETMEDGFDEVGDKEGRAVLEFKYDGMRVQIHKKGSNVKVFTRRLEDITKQFPDIVEAVRDLVGAEECIIEGEAVGYDPDTGDMIPFQKLSKRIKRKYDIGEMREKIPVTVNLFDMVYLEGQTMIDSSLNERWSALENIIDQEENRMKLADHIVTSDIEEAQKFYQKALNQGQEGIMMKSLKSEYQPGSRVGHMVKLKPVMEKLDLTIVAAEWGEGRRSDWMGSYTLACRDKETGEFETVGNMATGFTDEQLEEMTERLRDLVVERKGRELDIRPEVVVEVAYEEIQESPKYSSGFALRFPRLVQVRDDVGLDDVDSLEKINNLYENQS